MKKTPLMLLLFTIVAVAAVVWGIRVKGSAAAMANATQYKLTRAERGEVKKTVSATGTLQAWSTVDIKSKAGGRINELLVEVGDHVKKGQIIARIDPADSLLSVQQSQADVDSGNAKIAQANETYQLQIKQSEVAIETARAQLAASMANRNAAQARLKTAQNAARVQPALTSATVRQSEANYNAAVKQRQQLDATQAQDQATAQANYDDAKANLDNLNTSRDRQDVLVEKGFVAQQTLDQAIANAKSAQAQVNAAKKKLDTLGAAQQAARAAQDAQVAQAKAALDNARTQPDIVSKSNAQAEAQAALAQAEAQVQQQQATLNQAIANRANNQIKQRDIETAKAALARSTASLINTKETLDQTVVRAPSDGVVLKKYVEQGTIITSGLSLSSDGTSIVQLADVNKMYVDVSVDETDIASVDDGQTVDVTIEAYPGVPFSGKVARIDPQATVESNVTTIPVRVEIDNSSATFRLLKPAMNATCEFIVDEKKDVITLPTEAVREDDNGKYVETATGGQPAPPTPGMPADPDTKIGIKKNHVPVEVGIEGNDGIEILSGVKEGDQVITQTIEPTTTATTSKSASPFGGGGPGGPPPGGGGGGRR
jgi:HlyD family secretion protein